MSLIILQISVSDEWIHVHSVNFWLVIFSIILNKLATSRVVDDDNHREEWVVRIQGGPQVASLLALQSGYRHLGPVCQSIKFLNKRYSILVIILQIQLNKCKLNNDTFRLLNRLFRNHIDRLSTQIAKQRKRMMLQILLHFTLKFCNGIVQFGFWEIPMS